MNAAADGVPCVCDVACACADGAYVAAERTALGAEALKHLTAAEQTQLFASAPETVTRTASELYAAAIANVAAAFSSRNPASLQARIFLGLTSIGRQLLALACLR